MDVQIDMKQKGYESKEWWLPWMTLPKTLNLYVYFQC